MRFIIILSILAGLFIYSAEWYIATAFMCPAPIAYALGVTDERFAISKEELQAVFNASERVWEEALGRELFVYDAASPFTINFIYDERQKLASTEEEWRVRLDVQQKAHEALAEELESAGTRYESLQASYTTKRETYEAKLAAHNSEVEEYNEGGGAPTEVFASLEAEASTLRSLARELSVLEREINDLAVSINTLGEEGNQKITAYNAEVLEYNAVFGTLETFTQGDFKRERINIYKFTDVEELTRVITHEFGHALGVPHVSGSSSVMYYLMTEQAESALSSEDRAALVAVCGEEETWQQSVRHLIRSVLSKFT